MTQTQPPYRVLCHDRNHLCGVVDQNLTWIIEPEYPRQVALAMCQALNTNPALDPDELTRIVEAA